MSLGLYFVESNKNNLAQKTIQLFLETVNFFFGFLVPLNTRRSTTKTSTQMKLKYLGIQIEWTLFSTYLC
jgi:ribonucleotide reductase beta subunit family protein with ferritin-like domain